MEWPISVGILLLKVFAVMISVMVFAAAGYLVGKVIYCLFDRLDKKIDEHFPDL